MTDGSHGGRLHTVVFLDTGQVLQTKFPLQECSRRMGHRSPNRTSPSFQQGPQYRAAREAIADRTWASKPRAKMLP